VIIIVYLCNANKMINQSKQERKMIRVEFCVEDRRARFGHRAMEAIVPCDNFADAFQYVYDHYNAIPTKTMRYTVVEEGGAQ